MKNVIIVIFCLITAALAKAQEIAPECDLKVTTECLTAPTDTTDGGNRWAIKSNLGYMVALVTNLGVEYSFKEHYSVDLPVIYSPYTVKRSYRLRFLVAQPEFRYWLDTQYKGHFFGAHAILGAFNISCDSENRYQSPKGFYGLGVSYGYSVPFKNPHWGMEFSIGLGYTHTKYDTYYNIPNGARFEKGKPYNYFGPTKIGITLVYKFNKYKEKR